MATRLTAQAIKDDLAFVKEQLRQHTDPYDTIRYMWQQRGEELEQQLRHIETDTSPSHAEVALLFNGAPVRGTEEIKLDFATKMLDQYQALVGILVAERGGTSLGARGQLPQSFTSRLFIRDMVRGSVGFLLEEPIPTQSSLVATTLKEAVEDATAALADLAGDAGQFQRRTESMSGRAISAVKKIVKTLNDSGAELKIVGADKEVQLDSARIAGINTRLNEVEVVEERETVQGTLLGLFPDRQQYEFQVGGGGPVLHGPVSEELDQRYMTDGEFRRSVLLQPVTARFLTISKMRGGQLQDQQKILENITAGGDRLSDQRIS